MDIPRCSANDDDEYPSAEMIAAWPNCAVPDCPNKSCLSLRSDLCYPHTLGLPFDFKREDYGEERLEVLELMYWRRVGGF